MDVSVIRDTSQLLPHYPCTFTHQGSTLHLDHSPSAKTVKALQEFIGRRKQQCLSRLSAKVRGADTQLFAKAQSLESLKTRMRITLGRTKANGMYDWPVEELLNTVEAHRRGANVSRIIGFGYTRSRLGIAEEFFVITRFIDQHLNGLEWLDTHPDGVETLIARAFKLLKSLNDKNVVHMDFWAANVMLPIDDSDCSAKAIDLENCFSAASPYPAQTLGFQFGFFYHRELYRFITEAQYDALVEQALAAYGNVDREGFEAVYRVSKHVKIGRKERRDIYLRGDVVTG